MAVVPHMQIPFRVETNGSVAVLEQNTVDEISQCVRTLMVTRVGERQEVPDYGIPDQPFLTIPNLALGALKTQIERWEERAEVDVSSLPDAINSLQRDLRVVVRAKTDVLQTSVLNAYDVVENGGTIEIPPPEPDPLLTTWDSLGTLTWDDAAFSWDSLG